MPAVPPMAMAAEPAITIELMDWLASVVNRRSPSASTLVSLR